MSKARCIRCDYDLDGLSDDAVCPECALPAMRSRSQFFAGLDADTRQMIEGALTSMGDCLQVQVVAVPLLFIIGVFGSALHPLLGAVVLSLAAALPGLLALRMSVLQRPVIASWERLAQSLGVRPSKHATTAPSIIFVSHTVLAVAVLILVGAAGSREIALLLLLVALIALLIGWIGHALYFRALARMLSDMNESLLHAKHSQALRSWMRLWPIIWYISLPLCGLLVGVLGYVFVLLSVSAWLQQTSIRVRASGEST